MEDPRVAEAALERYRNAYLKLRGALHDRNTGLPAYPVLVDALRGMLDQRRQVGVVHVEAANLDLVESLYGWQVFDRVLARASDTLRESVGIELPAGAMLAVAGVPGDRFVVFIPEGPQGADADGAWLAKLAGQLRARLEQAFDDDDDLAGISPRLEFRAGWSLLSENPFYRFERRVQQAVEEARAQHRRREQRRDQASRAELRRILRDEAISVLFQPVLDLGTRRVFGFEALTRGPVGSLLEMPRAMFALSGRMGAGADLDRLCRSAALRASAAMRGGGKLFLNVLATSLADPEWKRGAVTALLDSAARRPEDVVLEVSERSLGQQPQEHARACDELRSLGFGLALDDVGTGYASLLALEALRPDYLKVDASLVRGIHEQLIKRELFTSIVQAAARIGAPVVAVGVEAEEEADTLRRAGASYGQGYLFALPGPAGRFAPGPAAGH